MSDKLQFTLLLAFILFASILYNIYNNLEKIPKYMDEEFHLEQTISYFKNKFNYWNDKLTTFPGTFLLSSVFLKIFSLFNIKINENNAIKILRLFTVIIGITSFFLLGLFKKKLNVDQSLLLKFQLLAGFFPINYFFNFLFYTETFSNLSLIIYFYLNLYASKSYILRFLSAILCISIRQNNIIWINLFSLNDVILLIQNFFIKKTVNNIFAIIIKNIDILIIDILFIIFIIHNDFSVVLGDKSHHNIVFHLAQMNHLLIFSLIFFPAINLKVIRNANKIFNTRKKVVRFILIFFIILFIVLVFNRFSYTHDFILADNRHYIFYYFKKIYLKDNLRYALLIYVSFIFSIIINDNIKLLQENRIISLYICSFLCLIPAKLVEIRYFAPCYLIFIILVNYNKEGFLDLHNYVFHWLNIIWHAIINGITFYIFLFKPFQNKFMNNEISRFMY